jgi:histone H3/H4
MTQPVQKPQSAYFIFSGEQRRSIKDELLKEKEKVSMGEVAKAIGARWKALSDEDRRKYQDMAVSQKEAYEKALAEGLVAGGAPQDDDGRVRGAARATATHSALPLSMVKKLATSDTDVKRISGEALKVITEATGMFLGSLASGALDVAASNKKKNFKFEDIVALAKKDARLIDMGLLQIYQEQLPFKDWCGDAGHVERKRPAGDRAVLGGKKQAARSAKGGIASYLAKKNEKTDADTNKE